MAEEVKILIFKLDEQYFAADIREVERILNYEKPTVLPECDDFLEGVINYQDGVLPVIDLGKKLGIATSSEEDSEKKSIIVAKNGNDTLGIVVESVNEVTSLDLSMLEEAPAITSNISKRYIKGLIKNKDKNQIILLLKLNEVLSKEEKEQLVNIEG